MPARSQQLPGSFSWKTTTPSHLGSESHSALHSLKVMTPIMSLLPTGSAPLPFQQFTPTCATNALPVPFRGCSVDVLLAAAVVDGAAVDVASSAAAVVLLLAAVVVDEEAPSSAGAVVLLLAEVVVAEVASTAAVVLLVAVDVDDASSSAAGVVLLLGTVVVAEVLSEGQAGSPEMQQVLWRRPGFEADLR